MGQVLHYGIESAKATPVEGAPGRFRITVITPGMGSSGYYEADVLKEAADRGMWPEKTKVYFDHPTESENWERPARSVRDLVGYLTEAGAWDESGPDGPGVYATMQIFPSYAEKLSEMKDIVGMSIRGRMRGEYEEVPGGMVLYIKSIEGIESVDVVTTAGRGGRIIEALESAWTDSKDTISAEIRALLESGAENRAAERGLRAPAPSVTSENSKPSSKETKMELTNERAGELVEALKGHTSALSAFTAATAAAQNPPAGATTGQESAGAESKAPAAGVDAAFALAAKIQESGLGAPHLDAVKAFMASGKTPTEAIEAVKGLVVQPQGTSPAAQGTTLVPNLHMVLPGQESGAEDLDLDGFFGQMAEAYKGA